MPLHSIWTKLTINAKNQQKIQKRPVLGSFFINWLLQPKEIYDKIKATKFMRGANNEAWYNGTSWR